MTRRTKHRFPSPELSPTSSSSETPQRKNHRKISKLHQSPPYEPHHSKEEEEEDDDDDVTSVTSPTNHFLPSLSHISNAPNSGEALTHIDSYINIAPFPIFGGKSGECPATHLSRFSKVCRANNIFSVEMMMRIFPVTLENEAAQWYDLNVEPYPFLTWEEIKSSFLDSYRKTEYDKQLGFELMNVNQEQGESVGSYVLRLQRIINQWPGKGIPDPLIKVIFIDGLIRDCKDWVILQKPDSLADVLRLAFTWEQVRIIRIGNQKNDVKCGFCDGEHEESECEIRERMRKCWIKNEKEKRVGNSMEKIEIENESGDEKSEELVSVGDSKEKEGVWINEEKKSRCQCSKHQCGRKKLESNKCSIATVNSNNLR